VILGNLDHLRAGDQGGYHDGGRSSDWRGVYVQILTGEGSFGVTPSGSPTVAGFVQVGAVVGAAVGGTLTYGPNGWDGGALAATGLATITGMPGLSGALLYDFATGPLIGGGASDIFMFRPGFGLDTITDFSAGAASQDVMEFTNDVFADFASVLTSASQVGSDTLIMVDASNTVTLKNVAMPPSSSTGTPGSSAKLLPGWSRLARRRHRTCSRTCHHLDGNILP